MQTGMIDSGQLTSKNVNVASTGAAIQHDGTAFNAATSAASVSLKWGVLIKALAANSGFIYVGNTGGDVTLGDGIQLDAGEQIFIACSDLGDLLFDTDNAGDDARLLYG